MREVLENKSFEKIRVFLLDRMQWHKIDRLHSNTIDTNSLTMITTTTTTVVMMNQSVDIDSMVHWQSTSFSYIYAIDYKNNYKTGLLILVILQCHQSRYSWILFLKKHFNNNKTIDFFLRWSTIEQVVRRRLVDTFFELLMKFRKYRQ